MSLALIKKARLASFYVIFNHFSLQFIKLLSNLILTRLLVPELFGVMALIFTMVMALHMVSDLGVRQAVVRSKHAENERFLKVAWTIKLLHSFSIGIVIILLGCFLSMTQGSLSNSNSALAHPDLPYALIMISLAQFIAGLNSIRIIDYFRKLKQKELFIIELTSQIISLAIMIALAYYFRNIYALVFGTVSASFVKFVMSYAYLQGVKSGFLFDTEYVKEIISFGKWIAVSSVSGFIVNSGDKILLGVWVSSSLLGFYSIAQILAQFIKRLVQKLMSSIFFPILSDEVRNDRSIKQIEKIYYSARLKIDIVCCLFVGFIFYSADFIISILYDERYAEVAGILKILSFSAVWVGGQLATQLFLAYGKSKLFSHVVMYQALVFLTITPMAFYLFGFYGVVFSVAINPIVQYIFTCYYMKKYFFLNVFKELRGLIFIPIGVFLGFISIEIISKLFLIITGVI